MASYMTLSNPNLHPDVAYAMKIQLLLKAGENQPENTKKNYLPKVKEWRQWCSKRWEPRPDNWMALAQKHTGQLPGDLVDEGKLFLFMQLIKDRAPKKGKRLNAAKRKLLQAKREPGAAKKARIDVDSEAEAAATEEEAEDFQDALETLKLERDSEELDLPAVALLYNTVCGYISALQNLYDRQKSLGENYAPHPQGAALKAMMEDILRTSHKKYRAESADRLSGSIKDAYSVAAIPLHTRAAWKIIEKKGLAGALRTSVDFLLSNHMLLRFSSRKQIELPDMFCLDLPKEGVTDVREGITDVKEGELRTPTRALVVIMRQGKTNQDGRIEYGAVLRHRNPIACLVSQLAFWLFYRWQVEGVESFPNLEAREDWYHIRLVRRSATELTEGLSAKTSGEWAQRMYSLCKINSTKVTHLPRITGAQNADKNGVSEAQIRRAGRWTDNDQMTGYYLTSLPFEYMRAVADFDPNWSGSYYIGRATIKPPESLSSRVWPDLDKWQATHNNRQNGDEEELATGAFIELMHWLREVLLQDSVFLKKEFPEHPIFQDPLFATAEYENFANKVREAHVTNVVDPYVTAIEQAVPAIADKLRVLSTTTIVHQKQTDTWHESHDIAMARLQRDNEKLKMEVRKMREEQKEMRREQAAYFRGNCNIQFTHAPTQQQQQRPTTPPVIVVNTNVMASSTDPSPEGNNRNSDIPNLKLPRDLTTITDLLRLWTEGIGFFPAVQKLEEKWGARWRPKNEKNYFYERNTIITEVFRQAAQSRLDPITVAANMDRTLPYKSINKWFKTIQAQGKSAI